MDLENALETATRLRDERGYEAIAKVIQTADAVVETLTNLIK